VQNIDLMNLAGFCLNCLSNWYREAAEAEGVPVTRDESLEMVYGMSYEDWKNLHQNEASPVRGLPSYLCGLFCSKEAFCTGE
ncbi:DUF1244 domain-containing protein, partial [Rhizobium leguminosarum]|uniref:DUF1244 domain-containing protein n=1 Tax=Rhizobium leguminosarum TaxID=384 RepID=UPI003F97046C